MSVERQPETGDAELTGPLVPDEAALEGVRELLRAQARYPSLFRNNLDSIALFRTDGRVISGNRAAMTVTGFAPGELPGREFRQQISAEHLALVVSNFRRAVRGETVELEVTVKHKSGRAIDLAGMLLPAIVDERIVGVYAVGKDVSDLKRADRAFTKQIQELSSLIEHHPDSLVSLDRSGTIRQVNASMEAMIGYREDEMVEHPYGDFVAPDTLAEAQMLFVRAIAGETVRAAITIVHRTGRRVETAGTVVPIIVDGELVGLYAIGRDVTDQRRLEAAVAEHADRLRNLYIVAATTGRDPDVQVDAALELGARTLHCESAVLARVHDGMATVTRAYGTGGAPAVERPLAESLIRFPMQTGDIFAIDDLSAPPWNAAPGRGEGQAGAIFAVPIDVANVRYGAVAFSSPLRRTIPFSPADREFLRLVGALIGSAVERGAQQRRLDTLAFFDALTGLPNRVLLDDRLSEAIVAARRRGERFAVHFVDLDGFKPVNDRFGHAHGDVVLRALAQRLERITRGLDVVARVGGDEFVVLQTRLDQTEDALTLATRIRDTIRAPLESNGQIHRISASVGIALYPIDGTDGTTLMKHADEALYRVKATGRDGSALFTEPSP